MNVEIRMAALQKKHAELEETLKKEESRPLPDATVLQRIKHEKLKVKEEIENLKK